MPIDSKDIQMESIICHRNLLGIVSDTTCPLPSERLLHPCTAYLAFPVVGTQPTSFVVSNITVDISVNKGAFRQAS